MFVPSYQTMTISVIPPMRFSFRLAKLLLFFDICKKTIKKIAPMDDFLDC